MHLECTQGFMIICPCNLVSEQTLPSLDPALDTIIINILTKFPEHWIKSVPSLDFDVYIMRINILT